MSTDAVALRIGTRGSPLARWQADWVAAQLLQSGVAATLVHIATEGDRQQRGSIEQMGTQGVFTKEIQRALLAGQVDLAVHSLKDLPTEPAPGLCLAAVPARGPSGDVLVSRQGLMFDALPQGALIGTGSSRRRSQLWHVRADLRIADVRGNVDTRLRKLHAGEFDALVLAEAGLARLGLGDQITQVLPRSMMLPAVGQGALGLETRTGDARTRGLIAALDHSATHQAVLAERAMLAALRGGCLAPVGAWARLQGDELLLTGVVLSNDGKIRLEAQSSGKAGQAAEIGQRVAQQLASQGAMQLIAKVRDAAGALLDQAPES